VKCNGACTRQIRAKDLNFRAYRAFCRPRYYKRPEPLGETENRTFALAPAAYFVP
jgi:hypothetical protein